jgi:hypothetical protein
MAKGAKQKGKVKADEPQATKGSARKARGVCYIYSMVDQGR